MYDPSKILPWLEGNVQMRRSRIKTLADIAAGAMRLQGMGVLALGRAMEGEAKAKNRIKRVDRFLGNEKVEIDAVNETFFQMLRPATEPVVVLAHWTDRHKFQQLVLALPGDGRALPFYWITVEKEDGSGRHDGLMIEDETMVIDALERMCEDEIPPIIIAGRGFGNTRWHGDIQNRGWHFAQRLACGRGVDVEDYIGSLSKLGIKRGWRPRDWGWGTMTEHEFGPIRLVSLFDREAKEPWYRVTNLSEETPASIVRLYQRRMWVEAMFRDFKNREWGMDMDAVRRTKAERHDRHLLIIALAYVLL